jgi:hypothetical protein
MSQARSQQGILGSNVGFLLDLFEDGGNILFSKRRAFAELHDYYAKIRSIHNHRCENLNCNELFLVYSIFICHRLQAKKTRVEAGSNTSTMTLRVVRRDEMGLKKAAP